MGGHYAASQSRSRQRSNPRSAGSVTVRETGRSAARMTESSTGIGRGAAAKVDRSAKRPTATQSEVSPELDAAVSPWNTADSLAMSDDVAQLLVSLFSCSNLG